MTLNLMLLWARAEYEAETPLRIHTSHSPKLIDADGVQSKYPDEGGIGLPFTAEIHRLLALRERSGSDFLMRRSIDEVGDWCRSKHPEHVSPATNAALCQALTWMAVVGEVDPPMLARVTVRPEASVRSLLGGALVDAAEWRHYQRERTAAIESTAANETVSERLRREHDVDHEQRTWDQLRAKYGLMVTWERESERRADEHRRLGCEGCALAVAA